MKSNLTKIISFLNDQGLSQIEIKEWFQKPQAKYFGLSAVEFIKISPKKHSKIVLSNLKSMFFGEAMGA